MDHGPIDPDPAEEEEEASSRGVGLGWDEGSMRNVEAGLGRGEGGLKRVCGKKRICFY